MTEQEAEALDLLLEITSTQELTSLRDWAENHWQKDCPIKDPGAIGGRFTYSFTPTSVGTVHQVACACGAKHDATKYEWW